MSTIIQALEETGSCTILLKALLEAGLTGVLQGPGPFTLFAPTDDAFRALPDDALASLLESPRQLSDLLSYHIVPGRYTTSDLADTDSLMTLEGSELRVMRDGHTWIDQAGILEEDLAARNGVVHLVDAVLTPGSVPEVF